MTSALIIRPSSLGDIVHAMPIVHDLSRHHPGIVIDWVCEEPFAGLVGLNRGVRRVIPVALRRWRHHLLTRATWREFAVFLRQLASHRYTAVIDLQEQVKGALLASLARGPVHGPDRASIREPAATMAYRRRHRVHPGQHLIDRCRQLAGFTFGYEPEGPPHFDLVPRRSDPPPGRASSFSMRPAARQIVAESYWAGDRALHGRGFHRRTLGRGKRRANSTRFRHDRALVPQPQPPKLAALLARRARVRRHRTHPSCGARRADDLAFVATDPRLAGVERERARRWRGIVPTPVEVIAARQRSCATDGTCTHSIPRWASR
jgi:hypothetical protein